MTSNTNITENKPLCIVFLKNEEELYVPKTFEEMAKWKAKKEKDYAVIWDSYISNWEIEKVKRADNFDYFNHYIIKDYPKWLQVKYFSLMQNMSSDLRKKMTYERIMKWVDEKIREKNYYSDISKQWTIQKDRLEKMVKETKARLGFS